VTQRTFDHSGPRDNWEYVTPTRLGCRIETSAFVLANGTWALDQFLPPTSNLVTVTSDLMDGRELVGTFCITEAGGSVGDEANEQTITLQSHGTFSIS
jgi:hypothetical protein